MAQYACPDCDATFTAPTDTETVRCPGCGQMVEQQPAVSSPPDQTLRDRIAEAPVRQHANCTELEWAQQERARFERLYTRETVRAGLAEARADNAARDGDIYQQRLERLGEGYTRERKRAEEAEAHRLALSEALGLGTGAPWDAIHDRATELGLPPLTEDPVAQRLGLVPEPADRAAVLNAAAQHLYTALFPAVYDDMGQKAAEGVNRAVSELRRLAAEAPQPEAPWATDSARIGRVLIWSHAQVGHSDFGQGYRTAQEDVRAILTRPLLNPGTEARQEPDGERRVYAWAQTIDTVDGGNTVCIPGVHHSGSGPEETAVVVGREDVPALAAMLAEVQQPDTETLVADPQPVSDEFLEHLATAKVREDDEAEARQQPETEEEGELVCVDECGSCDACGTESFGTPAEGWREAARFLRRTPRDSADFLGAIRGARLIEDELRRRAEAPQQPAAADTSEEMSRG